MDYSSKNKNELIKLCRNRSISYQGTKQVIVERLVSADNSTNSKPSSNNNNSHMESSGDSGRNGGTYSPSKLPKTDSQYNLWHLKKEREKEEREKIAIHKAPILTTYYFILESLHNLKELLYYMLLYRKIVFFTGLGLCLLAFGQIVDGPHTPVLNRIQKTSLWWSWWVLLGFLSSCGFGTGLHTFLLYLGPFIAKVTLAAYECKSTDFPEPPYPSDIICPSKNSPTLEITLWTIVKKVQMEAILWGVGTAIGELPPYFMARAARLSGLDPGNEEFSEFEEILHESGKGGHLPLHKRAEVWVKDLIMKVGFWGILICASVPNPLFDLAGMTCGHFLVPFWTFFGATCIGKAVVKMHIQQLFVIAVFSKHHFQTIVQLIGRIPYFGVKLQAPFEEYLLKEKQKLHSGNSENSSSILQYIIAFVVWAMLTYFLVSIINAQAKKYHQRISKSQHDD